MDINKTKYVTDESVRKIIKQLIGVHSCIKMKEEKFKLDMSFMEIVKFMSDSAIQMTDYIVESANKSVTCNKCGKTHSRAKRISDVFSGNIDATLNAFNLEGLNRKSLRDMVLENFVEVSPTVNIQAQDILCFNHPSLLPF